VVERRPVLAGAKNTPTTESELGEDIAKARLVDTWVRETMYATAGNGPCPRAGLLLIQTGREDDAVGRAAVYVYSEEADFYLLRWE
jgi:hypothetical protein